MFSLGSCKTKAMDALRSTRNWLKARLSGRSLSRKNSDSSESCKLSIVRSLFLPLLCLLFNLSLSHFTSFH